MEFTLNPLTLNRKFWEFLSGKPKHPCTLGSLFTKSKLVTFPLNRAGRMAERAWMVVAGGAAVMAVLPALPWIGPLGVASALVVPLINVKMSAVVVGWMAHNAAWLGNFVGQVFDQAVNGPEEFLRPQKLPKAGKAYRPQPQPDNEPSGLDRMRNVAAMFNGHAGQNNNGVRGATIWGDPSPQQQPQSTTNTYEQAFTLPTPEQIRIASSGGESVAMHDLKLHLPQPTHHQEPPPTPVYKPPGCDN